MILDTLQVRREFGPDANIEPRADNTFLGHFAFTAFDRSTIAGSKSLGFDVDAICFDATPLGRRLPAADPVLFGELLSDADEIRTAPFAGKEGRLRQGARVPGAPRAARRWFGEPPSSQRKRMLAR